MKILKLLMVPLLLMACDKQISEITPISRPLSYDLGISFPPVADEEQRDFGFPLLNDLGVDKIRIAEQWKLREASQGSFNWASLDARINWAIDHNLKVLLTIQSNGPDWACSSLQNQNSCVYNDNGEFQYYIEQLLQRYPNQIAKIQFGNEWMADWWYVGDGQAFTEVNNIVYHAVQSYSPETQFVLGGFTTSSLRFLAACDGQIDSFLDDEGERIDQAFLDANCGSPDFIAVMDKIEYVLDNALYDEVDIHLYDDAENWQIYFDYMAARVQKPIIITEFGGPNLNYESTSEAYQSERLRAYLAAIDSMEVSEAYYFKLVEGTDNPIHAKSGLITYPGLEKKESYFIFKELNK